MTYENALKCYEKQSRGVIKEMEQALSRGLEGYNGTQGEMLMEGFRRLVIASAEHETRLAKKGAHGEFLCPWKLGDEFWYVELEWRDDLREGSITIKKSKVRKIMFEDWGEGTVHYSVSDSHDYSFFDEDTNIFRTKQEAVDYVLVMLKEAEEEEE